MLNLLAVNLQETLVACGIGIGTVFVGLICIIIICKIMGVICVAYVKDPSEASKEAVSPAQAPAYKAPAGNDIPNKQEFIAAVSAAIAEDMGTDITGIRILSVKKL